MINEILAKLFDSFKAKNPFIAVLVLSLIIGFKFFLDNGDYLGVNESRIDEIITFVLLSLQGTRTTSILNKGEVKK